MITLTKNDPQYVELSQAMSAFWLFIKATFLIDLSTPAAEAEYWQYLITYSDAVVRACTDPTVRQTIRHMMVAYLDAIKVQYDNISRSRGDPGQYADTNGA